MKKLDVTQSGFGISIRTRCMRERERLQWGPSLSFGVRTKDLGLPLVPFSLPLSRRVGRLLSPDGPYRYVASEARGPRAILGPMSFLILFCRCHSMSGSFSLPWPLEPISSFPWRSCKEDLTHPSYQVSVVSVSVTHHVLVLVP